MILARSAFCIGPEGDQDRRRLGNGAELGESARQIVVVMEKQTAGARREFSHHGVRGGVARTDGRGFEHGCRMREAFGSLLGLAEWTAWRLRPQTLRVERVDHDARVDGAVDCGILLLVQEAREKAAGNHQQDARPRRPRQQRHGVADGIE